MAMKAPSDSAADATAPVAAVNEDNVLVGIRQKRRLQPAEREWRGAAGLRKNKSSQHADQNGKNETVFDQFLLRFRHVLNSVSQ